MFPTRSVERGPLEVDEPGPVGVAGHVEEADRAHEHVEPFDSPIGEAKQPAAVPGRRLHGHAEPQVGPQPELVDGLFEVLLELRLPRVCARPLMGLEREAVELRGHVDFGTRVGVVPPGAADPERRLVDREGMDAGPLQLHPGRDAAEPGADNCDPGCHDVMIGSFSQPRVVDVWSNSALS